MKPFVRKFLSRRLWRTILVLLWMVVSYLALTPSPQNGPDLGWDKLNHTSAFVALAFAAWLGFAQARRSQRLWMLVLLAYGGGIEILQLYVPGRSCEWGDLLADAVGIAVGAFLAMLAQRVARQPLRKLTSSPRQ
jgi:VanZ family protein